MLLEEFLKPAEVSQAEAAKRMGIPFQRLNSIINERRGVSVETALLFEAFTRMPAQFWLKLQGDYDLWYALRKQEGNRPKVKPLTRELAHA
jgi:addiction module HigA family antidote